MLPHQTPALQQTRLQILKAAELSPMLVATSNLRRRKRVRPPQAKRKHLRRSPRGARRAMPMMTMRNLRRLHRSLSRNPRKRMIMLWTSMKTSRNRSPSPSRKQRIQKKGQRRKSSRRRKTEFPSSYLPCSSSFAFCLVSMFRVFAHLSRLRSILR